MDEINELAIDAMHRHCNYKGVIYHVIDWTSATWRIDGNMLHFVTPDDYIYGHKGSVNIEEIYIGESFTMIITTTTERVEMWFKNSMETILD